MQYVVHLEPGERAMLRRAVMTEIMTVNNEIVTCPDPVEYEADLEVLENDLKQLEALKVKLK